MKKILSVVGKFEFFLLYYLSESEFDFEVKNVDLKMSILICQVHVPATLCGLKSVTNLSKSSAPVYDLDESLSIS